MPPKSQKKPKGKTRPKRNNQSPQNKERAYNKMRGRQAQRWRSEAGGMQMNQSVNQAPRNRQIGVAKLIRLPQVGMADLLRHRITWVMGQVYVGNGALGATNSVYFLCNDGTTVSAGGGGGFWVPIAPADSKVGIPYLNALMKLYRRFVCRKVKVHVLTEQSSTSNNLVAGIAPCRASPGAAEWATTGSGTAAAQTLANLMSISGMESLDSFENRTLDLTPYIAGGSGGLQNEFNVAALTSGSTTFLGSTSDGLGVVPCAVQVAGNSTVVALQGTSTHFLVAEMVVDLVDFVGAVSAIDPEGLVRPESREERRARLLTELSALSRDDREKRDSSPSKGKGEF